MDLTKLSNEDLMALKSGDLSKVSNDGLMSLKAGPSPSPTAPAAPKEDFLEKYAPGFMGPLGTVRAIRSGLGALDKAAYEGGGKVTDIATGAGLPPQAAAALGIGANVAIGSIPMAFGGGIGAKGYPVMENVGRRLMQSALKPDLAARKSGDAARAVETLLQGGFNVTKGGVEKMTAEIDKLDDALTQALKGASGDVSKMSVIRPLKDVIEKFRYGLNQAESKEAIKAELLKFLDHPEVQKAMQIPVETAQKIKRAIYKEVGDAGYGFGLKPEAGREAKKAIARGLAGDIERVAPQTADINKPMGDLINARDLAANRVATQANTNPLGLGWINPKTMIPYMMDRSSLAKSLLGRYFYSAADPKTAGQAAGAALGAYSETPPNK